MTPSGPQIDRKNERKDRGNGWEDVSGACGVVKETGMREEVQGAATPP